MGHSRGRKNAYKILVAKSVGKTAIGTSRHSREDMAFHHRMVMNRKLFVKKKFSTQNDHTMKLIIIKIKC
jgi:hypothetical protein